MTAGPTSVVRSIALVALAMVLTGDANGFGGALTTRPEDPTLATPFSVQSGLRIDVDTRWFDNSGYRPIRVRVSGPGAATSERKITLTFMATEFRGGAMNGAPTMTVRRELTLAVGEESVEALLLLPAMRDWRFGWWEVEVDGRLDEALSLPRGAAASLAGTGPQTNVHLLSPTIAGRGAEPSSRAGVAKRYLPLAGLTADELRSEPLDDWLAYSGADLVVLDLEELRTLVEIREPAADALRRWVAAGGTLWIEQAGASAKRLQAIDELLRADGWRLRATESERPAEEPPEPSNPESTTESAEDNGAGEAEAEAEDEEEGSKKLSRESTPIEGAPGWGYVSVAATGDLKKQAERYAERFVEQLRASPQAAFARYFGRQDDTKGWYAERDFVFGRVLAFRNTAFVMPPQLMYSGGSLVAVRGWQERYWPARHGVEAGLANEEFGNLLVPGVGVAPVLEFQLLITLFVLVIGPLNYWLLWRREQLQMLVVTTPLCAALFTLGLFLYAAVGDGFGVKTRVRSVTVINQEAGEAVSWSRVSQYAATAPDGPPALPSDTAVYAIDPAWESAMASNSVSRSLEWSDSAQVLIRGWLPTRTAVQRLLVRPHRTTARLVFAADGDRGDGDAPAARQVSNQLGATIDLLLVRDATGEWRRAIDVPEDEIAGLESVTALEALRDFRKMALEAQPEYPVGAGQAIEQTLERFDQSTEVRRLQGVVTTARLDANLGSRMIDALTGLDGGRGLDVPPRTYVAVTSRAIDESLLGGSDKEIGSFHVVAGRW